MMQLSEEDILTIAKVCLPKYWIFISNLCEHSCCQQSTYVLNCVFSYICLLKQEHPVFRFGVTVDGQFLPKPAAELLQSHQFNKVPLINGITNDECGYMLPNVKTDLLRFVFPKIRTSLRILQYIHI